MAFRSHFKMSRRAGDLVFGLVLAASLAINVVLVIHFSRRPTDAGSARQTVVYAFTPQCDWCTRNLQNITAIVKAASDRYRFVGISLVPTGVAEYVTRHEFPFPVYINPSKETAMAYALGRTPQTIVVSRDGRVLRNWIGAYKGQTQGDVEEFFGTTLPGLIDKPAGETEN